MIRSLNCVFPCLKRSLNAIADEWLSSLALATARRVQRAAACNFCLEKRVIRVYLEVGVHHRKHCFPETVLYVEAFLRKCFCQQVVLVSCQCCLDYLLFP